ncbi:MAG TPA: TIR domain-containing protein [Pyrinomonadaceae bacterium]|jgi:predicted nucleotide-binding protein|nr:TIR domain-containing protein [Pyrinomonadaceae bacterium]
MSAHVYISYSRLDEELALGVAAGLKRLGHKVTIFAEAVAGGGKWRDAMDRGMADCDALAVLFTQNSIERPFVNAEVGAARALNKQLIPIVFDELPIPAIVDDIYCQRVKGNKPAPVVSKIAEALAKLDSPSVFIVHGQNEAKKRELKEFLADLGLRSVILHEQSSMGKAIIEKFEYYAPKSAFACVLMTPDDTANAKNIDETKWRARQNVILELGWFMAKLGRQRVVILYQGELEIPSDILGVVYLKFNESVREVSEDLRGELRTAGLIT